MYGEYCYYIKGEGKDRVRGNETSIYPEFLKTGTNIGVGNLPLNGVISDNRTYPGKTAGVLSGKRAPELMNMDLGAISARQSAPTDGRDASGNIVAASKVALTSKQNSDAMGTYFQWGRKDPFIFATSSELWGADYRSGKYPVKIYTIDGVLIYQDNIGGSNKDKQPVGGTITTPAGATSMMETIKNQITYYGNNALISQAGHTKSLWNYYWTSYSRGTDGTNSNNKNWHNDYLDGYTLQRLKSIYDPCPFGFRVSSNGTFNNFATNLGWVVNSYIGGIAWKIDAKITWLIFNGSPGDKFIWTGMNGAYYTSIGSGNTGGYSFNVDANLNIDRNGSLHGRNWCRSVRCIEDCDPQRQPDDPRNAQIITLEKQTFNLNNVCNPTV